MIDQDDDMSWEASRAISYINELDRQNRRLTETSQNKHVTELEEKITTFERDYKKLLDENKRLQLRVAEFGLELGRTLK